MQVLYQNDHKLGERVLWSGKAAKELFFSSYYNAILNVIKLDCLRKILSQLAMQLCLLCSSTEKEYKLRLSTENSFVKNYVFGVHGTGHLQ